MEARVLPARGRVGILALILTESAFFSIFVAAYIFYIGKSLSRPVSRATYSRLPILNTICLLSSSVTIVFAVRALRAGIRRGAFAALVAGHLAAGPGVHDRHRAGMVSADLPRRI